MWFLKTREKGGYSCLLILGHTFGHAIETKMGYGNCCTAKRRCGRVLAIDISWRMGNLTEQRCQPFCGAFFKAAKIYRISRLKNMTVDCLYRAHGVGIKKVLMAVLRFGFY